MTVRHLTEMEIQEFVLGELHVTMQPRIREHLQSCAHCRSLAESYRRLFLALEEEEKPVFDFDLAARVLEQTTAPAATPAPARDRPVILIFVLLAAGFLLVAGYQLKKYLVFPFANLPGLVISLMAVPALLLLVFLAADLYRHYRKQLELLKFT